MNITILLRHTTKQAFDQGMRLIALEQEEYKGGFKCNGYKIIDNELYLSRYSDKCDKFPYEFNIQQTIDFAWGWYQVNQHPTESEPDTDGSTKVAFELTTQRSGCGSKDWGMFCSIKPIWFIYGK